MYKTIDDRLEVRRYETAADASRKESMLDTKYRNYRTGETKALGVLYMDYKREMEEYNATHKFGYFGSFESWICHNRWDRVQ